MSRLPDFIIVGAHKAGTTSIHNYLHQHPGTFLPSNKGSDLLSKSEFIYQGNPDNYLAQFKDAQEDRLLGEVSSVYFHQRENFVARLYEYFPNIKIIVILRNPIERAYSHALWARKYSKKELQNLEKIIFESQSFIQPSLYFTHLNKYLSYFSKEQISILLFDDLQQDPKGFMTNLYSLLGIDSTFTPNTNHRYHTGSVKIDNSYRKLAGLLSSPSPGLKALFPQSLRRITQNFLNAKSNQPKPQLSRDLRIKLSNLFEEEIMQLNELIEPDVSHWVS